MIGGAASMSLFALLTDFGTADTYVAQMKAVLLSRHPQAGFLDLTHEVPPQDLWTAGYHLATALPWLPPETCTIAVVDPGVGTRRSILLVQWESQAVIAPDNGLLTQFAREFPLQSCRAVAPDLPEFAEASATFHGRDLFVRIASRLAAGETIESISRPVAFDECHQLPVQPRRTGAGWQLRVLAIDHFGNIITNLNGAEFPLGAKLTFQYQEHSMVCPLSATFASVQEKAFLAYAGSSGKLEIAIRNGNAAAQLQLRAGNQLTVQAELPG